MLSLQSVKAVLIKQIKQMYTVSMCFELYIFNFCYSPVTWLERIEGALNETLLWHTILPALNFVDLLIESDLDALNPLGKFPWLVNQRW